MTLLRLEFPTLVETRNGEFTLTPLLTDGFIVSRRRYGDALRSYQSSLKKTFDDRRLDRDSVEHLLWLCFQPDYRFELIHLTFKSGMHLVDGLFAVAQYQVREHRYLCLPKLNYQTLLIPDDVETRPQLIEFLAGRIGAYIRSQRKADESFDIKRLYSQAGDSATTIGVSVNVGQSDSPFEQDAASLFSFFSASREFNGAYELKKTAEDLAQFYPDDLEGSLHRDNEAVWLERALFSGKPQPVVIVGAPGVGKSNLIQHTLVQYMANSDVKAPERLQKLWLLDPLRVIAGMSVVGEWERRFEAILSWVKKRLQETYGIRTPDVLYIDNPVALFRIGKSAQTSLTLSHVLKPYLERREIGLVLEATPYEWQRIQQLDRGFADLFQVLRLEPLPAEKLSQVYIRRRAQWEREYNCEIASQALLTLLGLEPGFRGESALPGSVLSVMRDIAVKHQGRRADEQAVYQAFQTNFHFRRALIDKNATLQENEVRRFFEQRLVGQPQAQDVLTDTVMTIKAQLTPLGKPLNTLLFIGPTGVGKTEAAKLLTQRLFSNSDCLVRIDLNEFVDAGAVHRLIGDGMGQGGLLTERVRYQKACVLLLDEIEKAHPKVHDLLLQLLDDGRLTDAMGKTTDFTQTVVIMTSNIGAKEAASRFGFSHHNDDNAATYRKSVEQFFRPEMINRINDIVVFNPLQHSDMQRLAQLHMQRLLERDGFIRRSTILNIDPACLNRLADASFDPLLGARALKRNLERVITHLTAQRLAELDSLDPIMLTLFDGPHGVDSRITRFRHQSIIAGALPRPEQDYALPDYQRMVAALQALDERLHQPQSLLHPAENYEDYWRWHLSDALRELLEPLQTYTWESEERSSTQRLQANMPFRTSARPREGWRSIRLDFSALAAQNDLRDYLNGLYQKAEDFVDYNMSDNLQLGVDFSYVLFIAHAYLNQGLDQGCLVIRSLVAEKGQMGVRFLTNAYEQTLGRLGEVQDSRISDDCVALALRGPGLQRYFSYEQGVHLFIEESNLQVPVTVAFYPGLTAEEGSQQRLEQDHQGDLDIQRLYTTPTATQREFGVTDLRTGLMLNGSPMLADWRLLISPACKGELRHGD
ncbi:AAA family ATPase [Hahella sp. NBU794]|uniref:AAA family ATPase n=1 Tax=Hahella sp. NBU794 TaxID=3422590 RepID=UPI003D701923